MVGGVGRARGVFRILYKNYKFVQGSFTVTLGIVALGRLKTTFYSFMGVREKYLISLCTTICLSVVYNTWYFSTPGLFSLRQLGHMCQHMWAQMSIHIYIYTHVHVCRIHALPKDILKLIRVLITVYLNHLPLYIMLEENDRLGSNRPRCWKQRNKQCYLILRIDR